MFHVPMLAKILKPEYDNETIDRRKYLMTDYREHMNKNLAGGAAARIKKGGARAFKAGGLWIYDNEISRVDGTFEDGDILAVEDFDGYFLGWGFINTSSKICIRMLSRKKEQVITPAFLEERVRAAWDYRKKVIDTSSCRVIFGEADFLPGITVDKYEDVLVVESLALGIDRLKPIILDALTRVLAEDGIHVRGIYERSDAKVREKEGLPRTKGFIGDSFDTLVPITENGVRYIVDVENGQKTGFFLDQKENRRAIARLCPGARVLDCFTHTGSFGLNAALAGAAEVTSVDASDLAIEQAAENAKLNGFLPDDTGWLANEAGTRLQYLCADIFDLLPSLHHLQNPGIPSKPPCAVTARSTREVFVWSGTADFWPPVPAPISWIRPFSGTPLRRRQKTHTNGCARWNSAPRQPITRSSGHRKNPII